MREDLGKELARSAQRAARRIAPAIVRGGSKEVKDLSKYPSTVAGSEVVSAPALNAYAGLAAKPLAAGTLTLVNRSTGAEYAAGTDFVEDAVGGRFQNLAIPAGTSLDALYHYFKGSGGGVTDHGALTGLGDDDHPIYHTDARGDARYVNEADHTKAAHDALLIDAATLDGIDSTALQTRSEKGQASGYAPLDASSLVPEVHIPAVAITDTYEVATEAAMLALAAQRGDVAIRSDLNKSFILRAAPASTLANWSELRTPTDAVLSVDTRTGAVDLSDRYLGIAAKAADSNLLDGVDSTGFARSYHKYHTFAVGEYYFDSYSQTNFLRLFTENAARSNTRFQPIQDVEYNDGTNWVAWAGNTISTLLDGREETQVNIDHAHRRFRFTVRRSNSYPGVVSLMMIQGTWSGILLRPRITMTTETSAAATGPWTLDDTAVFQDGVNTTAEYGTHMKVDNLHNGRAWMRVTIEIDDWVDNGAYTYIPLLQFEELTGYMGGRKEPWTWAYDKSVNFDATPKVAGTPVPVSKADHDALGIDAATLDGIDSTGFAPAAHVGSRDGHPLATATLNGLMASADKSKLDDMMSIVGPEVALSAATTLDATAFGKMHVLSGSADYAVTLPPVAGNAGKVIGFRVAGGAAALVTLDGNLAETIDGQATRAMWERESCILLCDGTAWTKIGGKSRAMRCAMTLVAAQSVAHATVTRVLIDSILVNVGSIGDTVNNRINIRRGGTYDITPTVTFAPAASPRGLAIAYKNAISGADTVQGEGSAYSVGSILAPISRGLRDYASGDYVSMHTYQNSGASLALWQGFCTLYVMEADPW